MSRHFFVIPNTERVYTHMDDLDDTPFVFEATTDLNPLDMDDPEVSYREYLADNLHIHTRRTSWTYSICSSPCTSAPESSA